MEDSHPAPDDAALIARIQSDNDPDAIVAFEELIARHHDRLLLHLRAKRLVSAECDEVAWKTWERAWQRIDRFQYRGISIFAWLRQIADRVALEVFRARYLDLPLDMVPENMWGDEAETDTATLALQNLTREQQHHKLTEMLTQAPDDYRKVIESDFLCEFSTKEIMELYGWSEAKVYTTKHRALKWLRERLEAWYSASVLGT